VKIPAPVFRKIACPTTATACFHGMVLEITPFDTIKDAFLAVPQRFAATALIAARVITGMP